MKKAALKSDINSSLVLKSLTLGMICGCLISVISLVLFAFILAKSGSASASVIQILTIFSANIGSLVAGYISLRILKIKGLIYGSICGIIMFLCFAIIGFIILRAPFTIITLIKSITMLIMGAVGGILGVNKQRK